MNEFEVKPRSHAELLKKLKCKSIISCFIDAAVDNAVELSPMKDSAIIRGYLWERTKVNLQKHQNGDSSIEKEAIRNEKYKK